MSSRSIRSEASLTSLSSAPVLIHSLHAPDVDVRTPRLVRPYPLVLLALTDLLYTLLHASPSLILFLGVARIFVLIAVGCSRRWRSMGGWVAGVCGGSVGGVVWEACVGQMTRLRPLRVLGRSDDVETAKTMFLVTVGGLIILTEAVRAMNPPLTPQTAIVAITEYLAFLVLLRISPPPHRSNPFAIRVPPTAIQSPTAFSFRAESTSPTRAHARQPSLPSSPLSRQTFPTTATRDDAQESDDLEQWDDDASVIESEGSSVSDSSIIDLPSPLSPTAIAVPPSLSITSNLNLVAEAVEHSPVIGPLVRRTRSARLLNLTRAEEGGPERHNRSVSMADGYGTFRA